MFGFFKKKENKEKNSVKKSEAEYANSEGFEEPKWYEVGEGNPFDEPILDIRSITLNIVATTRDKWIAENYTKTRQDTGEHFIDKDIDASKVFNWGISYPHNGEKPEGIVTKAESMDVKWDIYAYGEWFYFVRSWTSELVYKVHYQNTGNELVLDRIVTCMDGASELHSQNIHSMILTHVFGRVWPYTIPEQLEEEGNKNIALYLFSQFGCKATVATHANIFKIGFVEEK